MFSKLFKKAFTLIEVSVVLIVLSILIGSVLISRKVIERAKVNNAITDLVQMKKAISIFKDTYSQLPGDVSQQEAQIFPDLWAYNADTYYARVPLLASLFGEQTAFATDATQPFYSAPSGSQASQSVTQYTVQCQASQTNYAVTTVNEVDSSCPVSSYTNGWACSNNTYAPMCVAYVPNAYRYISYYGGMPEPAIYVPESQTNLDGARYVNVYTSCVNWHSGCVQQNCCQYFSSSYYWNHKATYYDPYVISGETISAPWNILSYSEKGLVSGVDVGTPYWYSYSTGYNNTTIFGNWSSVRYSTNVMKTYQPTTTTDGVITCQNKCSNKNSSQCVTSPTYVQSNDIRNWNTLLPYGDPYRDNQNTYNQVTTYLAIPVIYSTSFCTGTRSWSSSIPVYSSCPVTKLRSSTTTINQSFTSNDPNINCASAGGVATDARDATGVGVVTTAWSQKAGTSVTSQVVTTQLTLGGAGGSGVSSSTLMLTSTGGAGGSGVPSSTSSGTGGSGSTGPSFAPDVSITVSSTFSSGNGRVEMYEACYAMRMLNSTGFISGVPEYEKGGSTLCDYTDINPNGHFGNLTKKSKISKDVGVFIADSTFYSNNPSNPNFVVSSAGTSMHEGTNKTSSSLFTLYPELLSGKGGLGTNQDSNATNYYYNAIALFNVRDLGVAAVSSAVAKQIDKKIDDGKPYTGFLISSMTTANDINATYSPSKANAKTTKLLTKKYCSDISTACVLDGTCTQENFANADYQTESATSLESGCNLLYMVGGR